MARTKQTKKVKPFGSPERKLINKAIVKAKHKSVKKKVASVPASSHKDQKVGLFLGKDMQDAMDLYRQSRLPGFGERPLSIRAVCERFKGKNITFGYSLSDFPFTPTEIRTVVYEFSEENNLPGFSDAKEWQATNGFTYS